VATAEDRGLIGTTIGRMLYTPIQVIITVFLTLILFQEGLQVWQVSCFYLTYGLTMLGILYPLGRMVNRHGPRLGYLGGMVTGAAQAIVLTLFITVWPSFILVIVMGGLNAISETSEWLGRQIDISSSVNESNQGKRVALLDNLAHVSAWSVKLLTIFFAGFGGQSAVIISCGVLAVVAMFVIWPNQQLQQGYRRVEEVSFRHRATRRELFVSACWYFQVSIGTWLWTMYVSLTYPTFQGVGTIFFVASVLSVLLSRMLGRLIDMQQARTWRIMLVTITVGFALTYLARSLVIARLHPGSHGEVYVLTAMTTCGFMLITLFQTIWQTIFPQRVKVMGMNYIASMNVPFAVTQIGVWSIMVLLAYAHLAQVAFAGASIAAAIAAFGCLLLPRPAIGIAAPVSQSPIDTP